MFARKSFIIMVTQAIGAIMGMLGLLIIAKIWGDFATTALGVVGFGMAFVGMFSFITDLGFNTAHVKRISEGKDLGTCIGTFISIKLILTGVMVAIVIGGMLIWKYVLNQDFYDATKENIIYIFLIYYVLLSLYQIMTLTFNAKIEIAKSQTSAVMDSLVRVPLMIIVALAGVTGAYIGIDGLSNEVNITAKYSWPSFLHPLQDFLASHALGAFATAYLLGAAAVFIMAFIQFRGYPIKRPSKEYAKSYMHFALPIMFVTTLTVISVNVDKVMIGYFWAAEEVGYYFAVQRISNMLIMFSTGISVVLFPTISMYHVKKKFGEIRDTTHKAERYISMMIVPLTVFIIVFSGDIINIALNSSFQPAIHTLRILAVFTLIAALRMPYIYLVVGMDKPGISAKILATGCVINIILNYLFIPSYGVLSGFDIVGQNGAAIATTISVLITFIMFRFASRKLVDTRLFQSQIILHIAAGSIMGIVIYFLGSMVDPLRWYHLTCFALMGLGLYFSVLWLLKELRKDDINMVMDAINPKGIFQYFKSELRPGKEE